MVEAARGILNRFIPDIYIYTDVYRGAESGKFVLPLHSDFLLAFYLLTIRILGLLPLHRSPGFALTLVAESTTGVLLSSECTGGAGQTPEDVGTACALQLMAEISRGGTVDCASQNLLLTLLPLGSKDVGKIRLGGLTEYRCIQCKKNIFESLDD
jgi:RNA 3'-terminal phosphate cyclase-like protein